MILLGVVMLAFGGCDSKPEVNKRQVYTETKDGRQITYVYDDDNTSIISKNVYNEDTGITIEYFYFYENTGWGDKCIGGGVVVIDKDGNVVGKFDSCMH